MKCLTGKHAAKHDELFNMVETANYSSENNFKLSCVTYEEVLREIRSLRDDCSTGPDNITSILKLVSDIIASPLRHTINTSIQQGNFPDQWKVAKVTLIPKVVNPEANGDYRPISILPVISKVFELIIVRQICEFIEKENILEETKSGFRKSHSTTTNLLQLRDDILKSMNRGEITMAIFADYSKAFDTVNHSPILQNLINLRYDKVSVKLICSYLCERYQYV